MNTDEIMKLLYFLVKIRILKFEHSFIEKFQNSEILKLKNSDFF